MKRFACTLLIMCLAASCAGAETFLDDFNMYAESVFSIQPLREVSAGLFASDFVEVIQADDGITVFGEDALDVISYCCCVLRCVDGTSNRIDQYGRILHAHFLNRVTGTTGRATTESGVLIFFECDSGIFSAKVVK